MGPNWLGGSWHLKNCRLAEANLNSLFIRLVSRAIRGSGCGIPALHTDRCVFPGYNYVSPSTYP